MTASVVREQPRRRTGIFITFEGPEGAGKTTQVERLARRVEATGISVVRAREPGGTLIGQELRAMLLLPGRPALSDQAEALLLSTDRAQHVHEVIRPSLLAGMVVISDRYTDSTLAHQGYGSGLSARALRRINAFATGNLAPDITILIDIDPEVGLARRRAAFRSGEGEYNRIDGRGLDYHVRVREGFLAVAQEYPERIRVVDGLQRIEAVEEDVWRHVAPLID